MDFLKKLEEKYGENYPNELRMVSEYRLEKDEDDDGDYQHYVHINLRIQEKVGEDWKQLVLDIEEIGLSSIAVFNYTDYDCSYNTLLEYLENMKFNFNLIQHTAAAIYFFKLVDMHKNKFIKPLIQEEINRLLEEIHNKQGTLNELYDKNFSEVVIPDILTQPALKNTLLNKLNQQNSNLARRKEELKEYIPGCNSYVQREKLLKAVERDRDLLQEVINT
jgi:hypothetical protein